MATLHPPAPLPLITHTSSPTPIAVAETQLAEFLHQTTIDPSLRPDSVLSSRGDGPQSHSGGMSGSSNVNLTLWHLERVLKGWRGEDLGGLGRAKDLLLGKVEEGEEWGDRKQKKRRRVAEEDAKVVKRGVPRVVVGGDDDGDEQARGDGTTADEWQDREEFEREQDVVEGEVGDRDTATVPEVPEEIRIGKDDEMDVDGDGGEDGDGGVREMLDEAAAEAIEEMNAPKKAKTAKDKAERKSQKKERRKVEKKAREASRKG